MTASFVLRVLGVIVLLSTTISAQNALSDWIPQEPVDRDSDQMLCGNYTRTAWTVTTRHGVLAIGSRDLLARLRRPTTWQEESIRYAQYRGGVLMALDRGEFGAALWWVSGKDAVAQLLSDDNVNGFLQVDDRMLVLAGIGHLDTRVGKIYEVIAAGADRVGLRLVVDLGRVPYVAHPGRGFATIATDEGVVRVFLSGQTEWLTETYYGTVGPSSIAVLSSGRIYLGMRRFVVELVPSDGKYRETWYVPSNCVRFRIDEDRLRCECLPSR